MDEFTQWLQRRFNEEMGQPQPPQIGQKAQTNQPLSLMQTLDQAAVKYKQQQGPNPYQGWQDKNAAAAQLGLQPAQAAQLDAAKAWNYAPPEGWIIDPNKVRQYSAKFPISNTAPPVPTPHGTMMGNP
jgi:hypothetical protein